MPLQIIRSDITTMQVDAIVNAANTTLLGGGGVDGAIHRAAGKELLEECRTLGGCAVGKAKITKGYKLPCRFVIHTVGPVYQGGHSGEEALLASCYRESLLLAAENGCTSVAFPLISTGAYGYPMREGVDVATRTIRSFLETHEDLLVYLVVFDRKTMFLGETLLRDIRSFIDSRYEGSQDPVENARRRQAHLHAKLSWAEKPVRNDEAVFEEAVCISEMASPSLENRLSHMDESFSQMLLRKIDESGMTDAQCYKKANIDRKLFSKIHQSADYRPRKNTVLAFAIALELSLAETNEMLLKAGYALSPASKADVIVQFFIERGEYNIFTINEALFDFDQLPLC